LLLQPPCQRQREKNSVSFAWFESTFRLLIKLQEASVNECRMDLHVPTTSVGTRTDYSVGPWDYPTCAARYLLAWGTRTTVEKYSDRKLYIPCTV
jgi:hypothetical protein